MNTPRIFGWIPSVVQEMKRKRKIRHELRYWKTRKREEKTLSRNHFEYFYTSHFELSRHFYQDKKVLDIGCGPRGSLEWADMASVRVGLDPLAESYRKLVNHEHRMQYVVGCAEQIPFSEGSFDVVSSFNSLDHVDNIDHAVAEMIRVTAPGGLILLLTDIHDRPTTTEPTAISWNITEEFSRKLKLIEERHFEKSDRGLYDSILDGVPYDHSNESHRYGVLSARLIKPPRK